MGKCCWRAMQLFPIQILFPFPTFKLPPNFTNATDIELGSSTYSFLFFCFVSGIHEVLGIKF